MCNLLHEQCNGNKNIMAVQSSVTNNMTKSTDIDEGDSG